MKTTLHIITLAVLLNILFACQINFWGNSQEHEGDLKVTVERYDRLQSRYLTNADFSALQNMNTNYPMETRALIENVLQLGTVDQPDINERFLKFYQDTTLQQIIHDIDIQYAKMDDIDKQFTYSFRRLQRMLPHIRIPLIYTQIGALGQSVIVGDSTVGISLDKYLGTDYPTYKRFYSLHQRETMKRENIVPDCLLFYILSLYPLQDFDNCPQEVRDAHMGRVMHAANIAMGNKHYTLPFVTQAEQYMKANPHTSWEAFLSYQ